MSGSKNLHREAYILIFLTFVAMYKWFILPILFRFEAEQEHHFVCATLIFLFTIPGIQFVFRQLFNLLNWDNAAERLELVLKINK